MYKPLILSHLYLHYISEKSNTELIIKKRLLEAIIIGKIIINILSSTQKNTITRSKIGEKFISEMELPLVKRKLTTKKVYFAASKNIKYKVVSNKKKKIINPQRRKTTNNTTYHFKGKSFDKKLIITPKPKYSEKHSSLFKLNIIKEFTFSTIETE